jgi:hypothetical protein
LRIWNSARRTARSAAAISFQNIGTPHMEDHPHTE